MSRLYNIEKKLDEACARIQALEARSLTVTREDEIEVWASGKQSTGSTIIARNCNIVRTAVGRYTVTFTAPHPDGAAYEVLFGQDEDAARDIPKAAVVDGTQAATGFNMTLTVDDNGGAADTYNDEPFSFAVLYLGDEITDVVLS